MMSLESAGVDVDVDGGISSCIHAAALSSLSYCMKFTLNPLDVIPTRLAHETNVSLSAHLGHISPKIVIKASRFMFCMGLKRGS